MHTLIFTFLCLASRLFLCFVWSAQSLAHFHLNQWWQCKYSGSLRWWVFSFCTWCCITEWPNRQGHEPVREITAEMDACRKKRGFMDSFQLPLIQSVFLQRFVIWGVEFHSAWGLQIYSWSFEKQFAECRKMQDHEADAGSAQNIKSSAGDSGAAWPEKNLALLVCRQKQRNIFPWIVDLFEVYLGPSMVIHVPGCDSSRKCSHLRGKIFELCTRKTHGGQLKTSPMQERKHPGLWLLKKVQNLMLKSSSLYDGFITPLLISKELFVVPVCCLVPSSSSSSFCTLSAYSCRLSKSTPHQKCLRADFGKQGRM